MRLISLSANNENFRTVYFKNEGINLIVASQKNQDKSDKGNTTNGVGKSLLIAIIHFCLGSSTKKSFEKQLPDWEFTLRFSVQNREYIATRKTIQQGKITLNKEELSVRIFREKLETILFDIPENISNLTFRSLLSFFIRPRKASYIKENNPNHVNKPYQVQVTNAFLLGLDVLLAEKKYKLRVEYERIRKLVSELKKDSLILDLFVGKKDVLLTKNELQESIASLEENLKNFDIAENYYDIKKEADELKVELEKNHNQIKLLQIQTQNINESIKTSPDINKDNIKTVYQEASVIINNDALKQLSELESFYDHLSKNRKKRLLEQKNKLSEKIEHLSALQKSKNEQLNNKLKYLNAHQALDVFIKLSNKLADSKSKLDNLTKYEQLFTKYNTERRNIEKQQIVNSEKTAEYLAEIQKNTDSFFRALVKRFYPKSLAGITIYNNEKDNQIRYDIEAKIESDKSDGIGNVKLFCYDLTLLLEGFGHRINFLFHDSRLLDGIDPRQKHDLFMILDKYIKSNHKQYILTVNQNQLDEIKQYFASEQEYKEVIKNNIIHNLKDNAPEEKLLGIQVDMDYD